MEISLYYLVLVYYRTRKCFDKCAVYAHVHQKEAEQDDMTTLNSISLSVVCTTTTVVGIREDQ